MPFLLFKEQQLKTVTDSELKTHFAICHHSEKLVFKLTLPSADQALWGA